MCHRSLNILKEQSFILRRAVKVDGNAADAKSTKYFKLFESATLAPAG
jgi:hypothetical protein